MVSSLANDERQPMVSVCIPAYNHEKYIEACINSVLNQTFSDFEIVITDDCSSDRTADVVKSFSDRRIRLFQLPKNQGPSVAANNNFRQSRGNFICMLASDDLFRPEKIEQQLTFLFENPNIAVAFSYMHYVDEQGSEIPGHPGYEWIEKENCSREVWLRRFFTNGNSLSAPTAMIRRSALERVGFLDPRLLQTQDFDLWIRVCLQFDVHVMPERLIDYRIRENHQNTSASTPFQQAQVLWELAKVFKSYATITDREFFYRIFPEASEKRYDKWPINAILADLAMNEDVPHMRAFGLELMYCVLADEDDARVLAENGFSFPSFFRAMGKTDVFGIVAQAELKDHLLRSENRASESENRVLQSENRVSQLEKRVAELADEVAFWIKRCERTFDIRARKLVRKLVGRA